MLSDISLLVAASVTCSSLVQVFREDCADVNILLIDLSSELDGGFPVTSLLPPPLQGSCAVPQPPYGSFGKLQVQGIGDQSHPNLQHGNCPILLLSSSDLTQSQAVLVRGRCAYRAGAVLISTFCLFTTK